MLSTSLNIPGRRHFPTIGYCADCINSTRTRSRYIWFLNVLKEQTGSIIVVILQVSLEITGIIFVCLWPEEHNKCDTYFIYLYLHCAYWLIVMITDYLVKDRHHKLRINGYLEFYQSTYQYIRTPLFISSLWSTCYLLLAVILHHTHKIDYEEYCRKSEWFTPLNYILLLTTLELVIIVPAYINYISKYSSK